MADSTVSPGPVQTKRRRRLHIGGTILLALVVLIVLLIVFWDWDWFIPLVDADASGTLGRKVTMQHLHVRLGSTTEISATGIEIADPLNFDAAGATPGDLATIDKLTVDVDVLAYLHHRVLTLTTIEVDHPVATVRQFADGSNNYTLHMKSGGGGQPPPRGGRVKN
jgi:uncharacterized protein involved in outer membrane biogenesis